MLLFVAVYRKIGEEYVFKSFLRKVEELFQKDAGLFYISSWKY